MRHRLPRPCDHPNVVKIFEVGEGDGRHFIALEFLPENLGRVMQTAGKLSADRAATFGVQIADGLAAAHALGIVHRDIKPQNVLIGQDGTAKVTDFGIARGEALATMTATGAIMGTPHYMSPEQARGERVDARSDLYSLGCMLYQMLTGDVPFRGDTPHAVLRQHIEDSPEPIRKVLPDIQIQLAIVVERAMEKSPEGRYQSAPEMATALRQLVPGAPYQGDHTPPPPSGELGPAAPRRGPARETQSTTWMRLRDHAQRRPWAWTGAAILLLTAAVVALVIALTTDGLELEGLSPVRTVHISMASSITKWEWLEDAVEAFKDASKSDPEFQVNSKRIEVEILLEQDPLSGKLRHWNSPTQVAATLRGEIEPTILSPASSIWLLKLNKEWRALYGREITTGPWPSLLSTPVVVAMWESRARALDCWPVPGPTCTWERIRELAASPDGWGMVGHPEWGKFHFGYAYVGESDVATQTAVLFCMTGLGKTANLKVADVASDNACGQAIADVEDIIVHRGTSSPLILQAMQSGGPAYLDAVTTYEKNVIGFNVANPHSPWGGMVNVYPQDGTVIADHTFAIMDQAPWVTDEQVQAAEIFREFLFTADQQDGLVEYGIRPADDTVELGSPIDQAHGANPSANLVTLDVPDVLVVDQIVEVWHAVKKPANIVLVFDKSGSMQGDKIAQALSGAVGFVEEMDRGDWLTWMPFDGQPYPGIEGLKSEVGEELARAIRSTTARGETALYDAIANAYQILEKRWRDQGDTVRYGIVVLSDGKDTSSRSTLATLEVTLRPTESDTFGVQLHAIGIGEDAVDNVLTKIASLTHGRYWKVEDTATLEAVYRRISKYW